MGWLDGSWDEFYIDDRLMPGRVLKCDVVVARDIEKVKEDGVDEPETKDNGYEGAVIDLELELWREAQAATLGEVLSNITPRQAGGLSTPHSIFHPITNTANILWIYVDKYKLSMPQKNRMIVGFQLSEWFPEGSGKKTNQGKGTPSTAGPGDGGDFGTGNVPPPDPENVGADFS
jgi:hypothetical protein